MNHLRRFPFVCFCLTLISIAGFCYVFGRIELLVIAGVLALISWYVTEGPRGRTLPRWVSNLLVLAFLVNMFFDARSNVGELPQVLGRFTVWLLLVKLYERRTARDHGQLLGLSLLLMLIGCAEMPPPLGFGVLLIIYAGLGTYCLLLFQLYSAHERVLEARQQRGIVGVVATRPTIGRRVGPHLRRLAVGVGLGTVAFSVLIFVLFPRDVGRGSFFSRNFGNASGSPLTGFAREVTLGTGTRINDSPRVLFTVRVMESSRQIGGPAQTLLLRASALEVYEDGRWQVQNSGSVPVEVPRGQDVPLTQTFDGVPPPEAPLTRLRLDYVRDTDSILHLGAPWTLRLDGGSGSRRVRIRNATREVRLVGRGRTRGYEIETVLNPEPDAIRAVAGTSIDLFSFGGDLRNRRAPLARTIRTEAQRILRQRGVPLVSSDPEWPLRVADAFQAHLNSGDFRYTLDLSNVTLPPGRGPDADPIVHFLRESRRGHCEYFAAAHSALCQSVGVHARMVIGFAASEFNPTTETYVVRGRHAHAWTEVGRPGQRWRTYDPTPAAVTAPSLASGRDGIAGRVGDLYSRLEGTWSDRFVGFDPGLQQDIYGALETAGNATVGRWWDRLRQWASDVNRAFYFGPAGYVWLGIVGLAGVIAVFAAARWIGRRRRIRRGLNRGRGGTPPTERAIRGLAFYFDMLEVLRRAGIDKPEWQPPLEFSRSVAGRQSELEMPVRELAERYYRGRFGGDLPDDEEIRTLRKRVGELAARLGVRA